MNDNIQTNTTGRLTLVLQAQSQLKALYKDNMDTIIGNCDASLFLGGKEETTLKSWNSLLGKETIDMYNTSVTKGNQIGRAHV